jgi:phage tail protein X
VHLEPQPSPQGTVATTPPANAGAQYQDAQSAVPEKSVAAATSPASANAPDLQTSHPERAVEPPLAVGPPEPIPQTDGNGPDPLPVQSSNPPDQLGKLIVKPGDTLVGLVHQVYGTQRNAFLRAVIDANPQIADPNVIDIGNVLSFPPLPHEIRHPAAMPCWVQLSDYETLPEAVQRVHQISSTTQIPVQMIPNWSPNTGLRFQLLIKGYFPDEPAAAEYADALPKNYTGAGKVMATWPEGTVFYSDPYAGNAH